MISASPATVVSGGISTLTWSSSNADTCTASGSWSGARNPSGMEVTAPINAGSTYTLTCTGTGGMGAATANVAVAPKPTVTITATPTTVRSGGTTTLMWSTTDATSCTASGSWSGSRPTLGSETITGLTTASAFTLTCTGAGGSGAATANVNIGIPSPIVTIAANPSMVASGSATTLTWSSTDATSCTASGGWSGARDVSGTQLQAPITMATVYTLTCTGPGGTGAGSANVSIAPTPSVMITATPTSVVSGGATTLTWSSMNATSCQASGSWSGSRGTSGSETITGITAASAFTLTCTGLGGMGAATANVTIIPPTAQPTVTITANPLTVTSGGATTLTWASNNATSCIASGGWSGSRGTSGTQGQAAITSATTYTLMCTGTGGTGSASITVAVQAAGTYSTNFNLSENPISENGAWRRAGNTFTNVATNGGIAFGTNGQTNNFDDSYALLRGFGANYTAEAVVQRSPSLNPSVTHEIELLLRFTDDATTARGYECLFSFDGNLQIFRWDGANLAGMNFAEITQLLPAFVKTPRQSGDRLKASISGNTITVFINGIAVATASDSRYATGDPGIGFFTRPGGNSANYGMTSYTVTAN